jgi:predicted signal transduction protein with EAL and GGDEF domain
MSGAESATSTSAEPTDLSVAGGGPSIQELVQAIRRSTELAAGAAAEAAGAAERAAGVAEQAAAAATHLRDHPRRAEERRSPSRPFHWVATLTQMLDDVRSARSQAQADHAAIMELRSERDRWQMDSLTGVLARSAGEDRARIELDRARRLHTELICVFLDVSGLKATNDTYGHGAGDVALQAVAALLLGPTTPCSATAATSSSASSARPPRSRCDAGSSRSPTGRCSSGRAPSGCRSG